MYIESYVEEEISKADLLGIDDVPFEVDVAGPESVVAEVLQEEEFYYGINEPKAVELPYEPVNKSLEAADEAL
ncbi:MAG: hypothetical protein IJA10_12235 [Lachnospiraceae bacterium]|nr:hypothetical protein [Lachnospiraceae bacterium]